MIRKVLYVCSRVCMLSAVAFLCIGSGTLFAQEKMNQTESEVNAFATKGAKKSVKKSVLPDQVAAQVTRDIINMLKKNKNEYEKNPEVIYEKVSDILNKHVAFEEAARSVMGVYSHSHAKLVPRFTSVFRDSLVMFYSKVLETYKVGELKITSVVSPKPKQLKKYKDGLLISVPVSLVLSAHAQPDYHLSYSMMQDARGTWKIRNIIIDGINLGVQFKSQFSEALGNYHNSPKEVVDNWSTIIAGTKPAIKSEHNSAHAGG